MKDEEESSCGCKGIRYCALCQQSERVSKLRLESSGPELDTFDHYLVLNIHGKQNWLPIPAQKHYTIDELRTLRDTCFSDENLKHSCLPPLNNKLILIEDFITCEEEADLVKRIDSQPWILSQSGRRKQDFGPKVNFKHKKVKFDHYLGMPEYAKALLEKMQNVQDLSNYIPFELCNLEYESDRGSCIEFHIDDTWIWGERLISINLIDGSVMTLVNEEKKKAVYVLMSRRSLLCMAGSMRYEWKHSVSRSHITGRRIALTMREPSKNFKSGALWEKWGQTLIERGRTFIKI